jgi:MFS family permease
MPIQAETPLPRLQILIVALIQLTEAWNVTVLFPFVVFQVAGFGVPEQDLGFYSGLLAGSFQFGQFMSSTAWGRVSDRYGRKATIVSGLGGSMVSGILFGFSRTLPMAMLSRILSGLLNGNIGAMKSYLADITDNTNRTRAFSLLPLIWGVGTVIAPLVGGLLSQPAVKFPHRFRGTIFEEFPYLLPVLIGVVLQGLVVAVTARYMQNKPNATAAVMDGNPDPKPKGLQLKEPATTSPLSVQGPEAGDTAPGPGDPEAAPAEVDKVGGEAAVAEASSSRGSLLRQKGPALAIGQYVAMALLAIVFDETVALFCRTPTTATPPGLHFDSNQIGYLFAVTGVALFSFTLLVVPSLARRFGNLGCLRIGLVACIPVHLLFPLTAWLLPAVPRWVFWAVAGFIVSYRVCCLTMAFTTVMVLMNNSVEPARLGEVNGIAQAWAALARGVGPWMGGALWSFSSTLHSRFGGFLVYGVMATINLLAVWGAYALPVEVEHSWEERQLRRLQLPQQQSQKEPKKEAQQKGPQKEELAQLGELATAAVVSL